jgi:hypothetical protein
MTKLALTASQGDSSCVSTTALQQAAAGSTTNAGNHIGLLGVLSTGLWQGRARGTCSSGSDARVAGWGARGCGGVAAGHACAQEVAVVGVEGLSGVAVPCLLQGAHACSWSGANNGDRTHNNCQEMTFLEADQIVHCLTHTVPCMLQGAQACKADGVGRARQQQ